MYDIHDLLVQVLEQGGSDLHITVGMPPMMRLDGKLVRLEGPSLSPQDTRGIVYSVMSEEQRDVYERRWEHDFAYAVPGSARFRVNAYHQRGSAGVAFRLIPGEIRSFEELGLPRVLEDLAAKPRGFVLVTGPTGSGKSTTLAAMVDYINDHLEVHVITVEDPIEYLHHHKRAMVNQREVGADTRSFGDALKYILRQDPDVILVGEMRDLETMRAALTAAETGHLVLATLHTPGAAQSIDRIIDVFPPHQQAQVRIQLAGALEGVIAQQLLPRRDTAGRVVAYEVLIPTPGVRNIVREGKSHQIRTAMETGHAHGMVTMDQTLADLCRRGVIEYQLALQRAHDPNVLRAMLGNTR